MTKIFSTKVLIFDNKMPVWRIRDVYPGFRIRLFFIPDPGFELSPSRILIKEFKYFNPKKSKKMVSKL